MGEAELVVIRALLLAELVVLGVGPVDLVPPADLAGLLPGDKVLAIDGYNTAGIALDYAVSIIRGPKGTEVKLTILSNGDEEAREVTIVRDIDAAVRTDRHTIGIIQLRGC